MINWLVLPADITRPGLLAREAAACAATRSAQGRDRDADRGLQRWQQAMQAAGLAALLERAEQHGQLTLLAPDDQAFADFDAALRQQGSSWARFSADRPALLKLMWGHVLPGALSAEALREPGHVDTLAQQPLQRLGASGRIRDGSLQQARVLYSRQTGPQRHLHVIDRVLQGPQQSLLQLLQAEPELSDFLDALQDCGLDSLLRGNSPITVLAPSNEGMARLPARLGMRWRDLRSTPSRPPELLRHLLSYQLLPGAWPACDMPWGAQLPTVAGEALKCSALGLLGSGSAAGTEHRHEDGHDSETPDGGDLPGGQPLLAGSGLPASNGLLHRLAQPLLPPSLQAALLN